VAGTLAPLGSAARGPSDAEIVHTNYGEIRLTNPDTGSSKLLVSRRAGPARSPVFSPDGRKIAYVKAIGGERIGSWEIFVMNRDGGGKRRLTRNRFSDIDPAWSPDGREIAFRRRRPTRVMGASQIYAMSADGSRQRRLTGNKLQNYRPVWSPAGRRIAFESVDPRRLPMREIRTVTVGRGHDRVVSRWPHAWGGAVWLGRGHSLAFPTRRGLVKASARGGRQRRLVPDVGLDVAVSRDGRRLVFTGDGLALKVFDLPTDRVTLALPSECRSDDTHDPCTEHESPTWSQDGRRIAFVHAYRDFERVYKDIFTVEVSGGASTPVTRTGGSSEPDWASLR
jgi:TolB protein